MRLQGATLDDGPMSAALFQDHALGRAARASALLRLSLCGVLMALAGCSTTLSPTSTPALTFVVVRHAEKARDDAADPSLSDAGLARAQRLAQAMAHAPPAAVYATQFRRTLQTAQPSATATGLPVLRYEAGIPPAQLARQLRESHTRGVILVVGHSNTVPGIVAALSGETVPPMPEEEYGVLYRIDIGPGDGVLLQRSGF